MLDKIRAFAVAHVDLTVALAGLAVAFFIDGPLETLAVVAAGAIALAARIVPAVWRWISEALD